MKSAIPPFYPGASSPPIKRLLTAFALTRLGTFYSSQVGARVDPLLLRLTKGRLDHTLGLIPVLLLKVRGARSGKERAVPLLCFTDDDDVILVASCYGRPKLPAYHNLKANPEVRLQARGRSAPYTAREAHGEDRDRLFALAKQIYAGYSEYERRTNGVRRIPVMRLSPT
jgi:deazaflavin-dependent oxidoreductase (nitroreductase family)